MDMGAKKTVPREDAMVRLETMEQKKNRKNWRTTTTTSGPRFFALATEEKLQQEGT